MTRFVYTIGDPGERPAVTLLDLLLAIGLIGLLIGLLIPAVQQARDAALRASCRNTLRQLGLALHHYDSLHGRLPPLPTSAVRGTPDSIFGLGWMALVLPQLDEHAVWQSAVNAF